MPNEITPNRIVEGNSNPDGEYHTHQDATPGQRHLHDPQDILNSSILRRKLYYRNYVDCGDTLYVIVNENLNKIKQFSTTAHLKTSQNSATWQALASAGNNRRSLGIWLLLTILGNSNNSGLGLYKSINASKTEFIKIN
jgi:flagellar basal body L-ring protein FlgH